MKTRDAGGTRRAGHTVAPHQRECTCSVVPGSAHFILSCYIILRPRISICETAPSVNISKQNARPRIRRTRLFGVFTNMRILHAFNLSRENENQIQVLRGLAMRCKNRCINLHLAGRIVQYPSAWRHLTRKQYSGVQLVATS